MTIIKSITIPTLCHQSWQQMEQKEQGRYCTSCTKIVIDFTKMTNAEILDYLAGEKNVCGRFDEYQLHDINHHLNPKKGQQPIKWKRWLVAAGLLGAGFFKADAQATPVVTAVQRHPVSKLNLSGKIAPHRKTPKHSHKKTRSATAETGHVRDDETDLAARRSDIRAVNQLPEPVQDIDLNASVELEGILGGVSVSGVEINVQSRVEMFYQYMPWPINRLFK